MNYLNIPFNDVVKKQYLNPLMSRFTIHHKYFRESDAFGVDIARGSRKKFPGPAREGADE
jgi:hypothetical protein